MTTSKTPQKELRSALLGLIPQHAFEQSRVDATIEPKKNAPKVTAAQKVADLKATLKQQLEDRVESFKYDKKANRLYVYFTDQLARNIAQDNIPGSRCSGYASLVIDIQGAVDEPANQSGVSKLVTALAEDAEAIFDDAPKTQMARRKEVLAHIDALTGKVDHQTLTQLKKTVLSNMPRSVWYKSDMRIRVYKGDSNTEIDLGEIYDIMSLDEGGSDNGVLPMRVGTKLRIVLTPPTNFRPTHTYKDATFFVFRNLNDDNRLYGLIRTRDGVHDHFGIICK